MVTKRAATAALATLFGYMTVVEPLRQGPWYTDVRGRTVLIETVNPSISVAYPKDSELFIGDFFLDVQNWTVTPKASLFKYANGNQIRNSGYVTGWVYDSFGNQIRYYENVAVLEGGIVTISDEFPDGFYKAYFQLRRADGTPVIAQSSSDMTGFCSTVFSVGLITIPPDTLPPDDGPVIPPDDGGGGPFGTF